MHTKLLTPLGSGDLVVVVAGGGGGEYVADKEEGSLLFLYIFLCGWTYLPSASVVFLELFISQKQQQ